MRHYGGNFGIIVGDTNQKTHNLAAKLRILWLVQSFCYLNHDACKFQCLVSFQYLSPASSFLAYPPYVKYEAMQWLPNRVPLFPMTF